MLKPIDLYILIWAFFHIGSYFGVGGITIVLPILIMWSIIDLLLSHIRYGMTRFVAVYDTMLLMFVVYGVLFFFANNGSYVAQYHEIKNSAYLVKVLPSLLPFYTFYRNALCGNYGIERIRIWAFVFIVVTGFEYSLQLRNAFTLHADAEEVVNNGSYLVLGLLPVICLFKRKIIQVLSIVLCLYFIIIAFKRGPILIASVCILYYLYYTFRFSKNSALLCVLVLIALFVSYHLLSVVFSSSELLQNRWQLTLEGYSSGRDDIVSGLVSAFKNSDLFSKVFGHGAYGTVPLVGRLAHNDWIQILIDQGVVGVLVHAAFCWQIFLHWRKISHAENMKLAVGLFGIIYLMTSTFSMAFDRIPVYEMVILAYSVAANSASFIMPNETISRNVTISV